LLKSVEDINATKKRLRIEIPSDIVETEIKASLDKLRQQAKIPGFRPGKAPVTLIEKRFGKEVEGEVLERIIPEQLGSAIKEAALSPITMPTLEEEFQFKRNETVVLSVIVEVLPKIENLAYENVAIKDLPVKVEESDLEDTLKRLREQKAVYEVADKKIETDDFVSFEYSDSEMEGGEAVPAAKEIISKMGNEIFPPDLMERVIGKKKGDIVEFTTTFDQTRPKELAGKTANIKVVISEVKKKNLPVMDDEFAKDLGFENLTELREKLKEKIFTAKEEQIKKIQKAQIVNKLIEASNPEVPEALLERELNVLAMRKDMDAKENAEPVDPGQADPDTAQTEGSSEQKKEGDREAKLKKRALRSVQASLIIDTIGQKEGITVSDSEVDEKISAMAQRLSATPEAIRNFYEYQGGSLENLKHSIYEDKVMDVLLAKAVIEKENKGE
jgi:trigger factor